MSRVFGSRGVSAFPTGECQGGDAPPPPAYVSKRQHQMMPKESHEEAVMANGISCISMLFKKGAEVREGKPVKRNGFSFDCEDRLSSGSSSSIGAGCESSSITDGGEDGVGGGTEDEVQSKFNGGLGSMGSLESSLPIKRGLSNCFTGKSKSFASLSEVTTVEDLAKPDNPFNKRRRTLVAYKTAWLKPKRCFYGSLTASPSLSLLSPDLTLEETDEVEEKEKEDHEEEEEEEEEIKKVSSLAPLPLHRRKMKSSQTPRSFSLTDLRDA